MHYGWLLLSMGNFIPACVRSEQSEILGLVLQAYRSPGGPGIRLDGAMTAGNVVSRHFDSLLVKVQPTKRLAMLSTSKKQSVWVGKREFKVCLCCSKFAWLRMLVQNSRALAAEL